MITEDTSDCCSCFYRSLYSKVMLQDADVESAQYANGARMGE